MSDTKKTHRLNKSPQLTARYLADYMAATDVARRSILVSSKFPPIARLLQHDEAKQTVSKFLRSENPQTDDLLKAAAKLRARLVDSQFDRDLYDSNADYIERVAAIAHLIGLPDADILIPGSTPSVKIGGVKITVELQARFRRITKSNKVKIGAAMFRYSKGKDLKPDIASWQSAFILSYLGHTALEDGAEPENKLCLTIDMHSGLCHPAPTDSVSRQKNIEAACMAIAERWDNIQPPMGAVI